MYYVNGSNDNSKCESTYLAPEVPLGVHRVVDRRRTELLGAHVYHGVRVGLALAQHADVLLHQVLRLYDVNPQDALEEFTDKPRY